HLALTVSVNDAMVKLVEMPAMPDEDIRLVLKHNSRAYLQQDLPGYVFDHYRPGGNPAQKKNAAGEKQRTLIAGAKGQIIEDYVAASKGAGYILDHVVPCIVGPVNAFEK